MAAKRSRKRRRHSASSASSPSPAKSDESAVASILPGGESGASSSSDGADAGAGTDAPPLPPDPVADDGADAGDGAASDASSSSEHAERERLKRVLVLRVSFGAVFSSLPPHYGGGPLTEDESKMLAEAWELPLRPYWDQIFGPWMGAIFATFAVVGPRVIAARMKLAAAGVSPGDRVG